MRNTHQHSILFVDDDESVRDLVIAMMRPSGIYVHAVPSAEVGLRLLREGVRFDLLFTDIVLPEGMNGFDLAARAVAIQSDLKVLYVTGVAPLPSHYRLKILGRILTKPFGRDDIDREIQLALI
ncbi:MAG TPA: response regulator [Stellaceae bacterium]|nr:response regulator [Stellaceae bacterium]